MLKMKLTEVIKDLSVIQYSQSNNNIQDITKDDNDDALFVSTKYFPFQMY